MTTISNARLSERVSHSRGPFDFSMFRRPNCQLASRRAQQCSSSARERRVVVYARSGSRSGRRSGRRSGSRSGSSTQEERRRDITIVGLGRIGHALKGMIPPATNVTLVRRGMQISKSGTGPIYVATHNADLPAVVEATPESRLPDLVFVQNGMLAPWLESRGLEGNTLALVYFGAATNELGEVQVTDGGQTVVSGRYAAHMAWLLGEGGVKCQQLNRTQFQQKSAEKLLWATVFWVICEALGGITVGQVVESYRPQVRALVAELLPLVQAEVLLEVAEALEVEGVTHNLCEYSTAIQHAVPSVQMALAEFDWRNGWFLSQAQTKLHLEWLRLANVSESFLQQKRRRLP
mmetsp:Transcript_22039/g.36765  ORF Transcript_22039/g.36765 Transcript_22039/m.36765 type:complete len:349 (-) Transcript_22039:234-1280(-)